MFLGFGGKGYQSPKIATPDTVQDTIQEDFVPTRPEPQNPLSHIPLPARKKILRVLSSDVSKYSSDLTKERNAVTKKELMDQRNKTVETIIDFVESQPPKPESKAVPTAPAEPVDMLDEISGHRRGDNSFTESGFPKTVQLKDDSANQSNIKKDDAA